MSLLNTIIGKCVDSALTASKPLSRFTNTTFAQAGTSLEQVTSGVNQAARNAASVGGITDAVLYAPITAMMNSAIEADPSSTSSYTNLANVAINRVNTDALSNLSGVSNSLFDIQRVGRESIASGVSSFSSAISGISPGLSSQISDIGTGMLGNAGRSMDTLASSAFGAASSKISSSVSTISNAIADKATAAITANKALSAADVIKDPKSAIKGLPGVGKASTDDGSAAAAAKTKVGFSSTDKIDPPVSAALNNTDLVYQEFKLYIEGVQVPFESISISQAIGQLPRASIQVPPQAGLMDIARYYEPKVHVFYTDKNTGGDRLIFWGHIIAPNYSYSKQHGYATMMFECEHKNALMEQVTFEWSAGGTGHATEGTNLTDQNPDQTTVQLHNFNSELTMILALQGITGMRTEAVDEISTKNADVIKADPTKLDPRFKEFEKRLIGMPSSIMNLWNQAKKEIFANSKLNLIFSKMYLPLVEDGIAFFDRMSGHHFVENQISSSRQKHCNDHARPEASKYDTLLPPAFRMDIMSAAHTQLVLNALNSQLGFSNEQTNFYELFNNFFYAIEYDMVTLASPAEVPVDPTSKVDLDDPKTWRAQKRMAVETVVKPQLPFYYSPICNVVLPNMFHTIQVSQAENLVPTRVTVMNTALSAASNSPSSLGVNYRAPHSIREAVSIGKQLLGGAKGIGTLQDTTASSYNVPGKYELGRGIRHKKLMMPVWLSYFSAGSNAKRASQDDEVFPSEGTLEYKNLSDLQQAWSDRYGYVNGQKSNLKESLNPYSRESKVMAYERMLFAAADFDFTKEVVKSRTGSVEMIFNPYIVPGYPMDIIDRSPNRPSFHGLCASVTHSITSRSCNTSVSFMAAVTYTELSNYFLMPTHPWLQSALKLVNVGRDDTKTTPTGLDKMGTEALKASAATGKDSITAGIKDKAKQLSDQVSSKYGLKADPKFDTNTGNVDSVSQTLLGNDRALAVADQFYQSVLGVGAAYPDLMYNFEEGVPQALQRSRGLWSPGSAAHAPLATGGEGNDNYTGVGNLRLVSRQIESKRSIEDKFGLKFIDMSPENYNGAPAAYTNSVLTNSTLLEPGASMFLDYEEISDFIES